MEYTVEKISGNKVKIKFTVPAETFDNATTAAYHKVRGTVNVPGFRKGKAPRKLIEQMYGSAVFYDEALEALFPEVYMAAINEAKITPVDRPQVEVEQMEAGKDLIFACEVFVVPDVTLGEYKGIAVARKIRTVEEAQVDQRIEQEQKRVARSVDITDRALQNGDKAELDYSGAVDGVKFDGGTAEKQTLVIGSGNFIPGFEEQMIGMTVGEERDLSVSFPEEYHSEELKGKDAIFHVVLHGITCEELPELDDDFAAEVSDFDTYAEYRADIQAQMQKSADDESASAAKQQMMDTIVENAEVDVPNAMVEEKIDEMIEQMGRRMEQMGFGMQQYMQMIGKNEKEMREMHRENALLNVKSDLVMEEIVKAEGIVADETETNALLSEYAAMMKQTVEQLRESLSEDQIAYFTQRASMSKAMDMLWDSAVVTDEAMEAPAQTEEEA